MHEAAVSEFPFVSDLPKREKGRVAKLWDHFNEVRAATATTGMIVPQHLVADLLGVSKQRVCTLADEGRFEVIVIGGVRYLTERSVLLYASQERKSGRPLRGTSLRGMWQASLKDGQEIVQTLKKSH